MNHLAHALLSGADDGWRLGGLLGDFVRGRIDPRLPLPVQRGIAQHRAIDVYTDNHAEIRAMRARFQPPYRRYAGILIDESRGILDADFVDLQGTLETNVYGPLRLAQAATPIMRARGYGRIVNVSSEMGQLADMGADSPAYRLSKTALNSVTAMLAAATRGENILVNSCCPGWVRTDMGGASASLSPDEGADTPVWLATLPAQRRL